MKIEKGMTLRSGAYNGAVVVSSPSNGWVRLYFPSNVGRYGQSVEDVTFSARLHWLGEKYYVVR